ncbi:MAG TPA: mismatch-specific DNA-glycosylase [Vicinamibacteria bacterium]
MPERSPRTRARSRPLPDVTAPGLDVLFVGINPGLMSAREGHHFANPANGFWRLLHESGFTSRQLSPREDGELLKERLGITNLVARASPGVSDLTPEDLERGAAELARKIDRHRPRAVVFVGITGYAAFTRWRGRASGRRGPSPKAACGEQPVEITGARVFVLPNPSGRNAHFTYRQMLAHFTAAARRLGRGPE